MKPRSYLALAVLSFCALPGALWAQSDAPAEPAAEEPAVEPVPEAEPVPTDEAPAQEPEAAEAEPAPDESAEPLPSEGHPEGAVDSEPPPCEHHADGAEGEPCDHPAGGEHGDRCKQHEGAPCEHHGEEPADHPPCDGQGGDCEHDEAEEQAEDRRGTETPLRFELEGYYRVRGYGFPDLFAEHDGWASTMQHRLRLHPVVSYEDDTKVQLEIDALDDVVWGDNASLAATSLFAGSPSETDIDGQQSSSLRLNRVWMEFPVPIGLVKMGRQPSHWGLGLLANDGDGFDDSFGENHYGATYDRVLFATRPLAVAQGIMGKPDSGLPLFVAVGIDRLVEDPLHQYYGYACDPGLSQGDADFDSRCDSDGDGVTDLDHSYSNDERTSDQRGDDWWADQVDDVHEMIYVLVFKGDELEIAGAPGQLVTGAYVVHRKQQETDSNVLILDYYLNAEVRGVLAQFEGLTIQGTTSAITLPGSYDPYGELVNPLYKEADIWGYVGRLGYENDLHTIMFETGFASGDDYVADEAFTGRPLHADFNAGLLIYEEILARVTAATWTEGAEGLWSKGGVYNSRYIFPQMTFRPMKNTEIIGGWLMAWPHKPDGSRILCAPGDDVDCAETKATAKALGWEADLAIKHSWREHMLFSLEAGYAQTTDRIPVEKADLNPDGRFFTLQSRVAYEF